MAAYNLTDFLACCSAGPGDNYSGPGVFINVFLRGSYIRLLFVITKLDCRL